MFLMYVVVLWSLVPNRAVYSMQASSRTSFLVSTKNHSKKVSNQRSLYSSFELRKTGS